jgi:hypothetical protein
MVQYAEPTSEISAGNWSLAGGATDTADGTDCNGSPPTPDDAEYVTIDGADGGGYFEVLLETITAPSDPSSCTVYIRERVRGGVGGPEKLDAWLYEGGTLRATIWTNFVLTDTSFNTDTISAVDLSAVSDWSDLRIRVGVDSLASGEDADISMILLEAPDAATGRTANITQSLPSFTQAATASVTIETTVEQALPAFSQELTAVHIARFAFSRTAVRPAWATIPKASLSFAHGSSQYVNHGSDVSLDDLDPVTVMVWAWVDTLHATERNFVFGKASAADEGISWTLGRTSGVDQIISNREASSNANVVSDTSNFAAWGIAKWMFCAFVHELGGTPRLLVGDLVTPPAEPSSYNSQVGGSTPITSDAGQNLYVGNIRDLGSTWRFGGDVALVHVVAANLTNKEIIEQWEAIRPLEGRTRLLAHYGEGTQTQFDLSGNNNHGTTTGGPTIGVPLPREYPVIGYSRIVGSGLVGDHDSKANISQSLPAFTQAATATAGAANNVAIDQSLPAFGQAATAAVTVQGAVDQAIPSFGQAATAAVTVQATVDQTLPTFTQAAVAQVAVQATIEQSLPAFTQAATAQATVQAAAEQSLPVFGQAATASVTVAATVDQTLPAFAQAATGAVVVQAAIEQSLPTFTQAATAEVVEAGAADIDQSLPVFGQSATAAVIVAGTVEQALPAFGQAAVVAVIVQGVVDQSLPAFSQAAVASTPATGTVEQSLPTFGQAATAAVTIQSAIEQTLPSFTQAATAEGAAAREADIEQSLPAFGQEATAKVAVQATIEQFLPSFGQALTATATVAPTVPGLEWTLPTNRMHHTMSKNRMQYTMPANRMHFTMPEED